MRKILVVVDMQNDFIDGSLGTAEARAIVDGVKAKIAQFSPENVFVTMDTHGSDYMEGREGRFLPVEHCIKGSKGWEVREELKDALQGAKVYEKPTFGSIQLMEDMKKIADKEEISVELVGLCTDICVVSNALLLKAAMPETDIIVDSSCCAGVTPEKHEAALETMRSCQIQVI